MWEWIKRLWSGPDYWVAPVDMVEAEVLPSKILHINPYSGKITVHKEVVKKVGETWPVPANLRAAALDKFLDNKRVSIRDSRSPLGRYCASLRKRWADTD